MASKQHYRASMRMGALNLLVVVVAICVVVLGVLAIASAHASITFTEKQKASMAQGYAEEAVASEMLFEIGEVLGRDAHASDGVIMSEVGNKIDDIVTKINGKTRQELQAYLWVINNDELINKMGGIGKDRTVIGEDDSEYLTLLEYSLNQCPRGAILEVVGDIKTLTVIIGIREDGSTVILSWKSLGVWEEPEQDLWISDSEDAVQLAADGVMSDGFVSDDIGINEGVNNDIGFIPSYDVSVPDLELVDGTLEREIDVEGARNIERSSVDEAQSVSAIGN